MKWLIVIATGVALLTSPAAAATKKKPPKSGHANSQVQRTPSPAPFRANADLKYGPQPDYPQSPPGF